MTSEHEAIVKNLKNKVMSLETQNYLMRRTLESIYLQIGKRLKHKFGRGLV